MVSMLLPLLLSAQKLPEDIQAEKVAGGLKYADGIVWSRDGFLVFADAVKREVYRLDAGAPPKPTKEDENGAQGLAYDLQGRLYFCESMGRRIVRLDRRGKMDTVIEGFEGKKLNSPNDIVVRKDGQIYFTDPAFASAVDTRELDFNGIFHINPKGEVEAVARWKTRPDGIAFSNDGKTLFVTDSDRHAVVAFDLDGRGGAANQRDVITGIKGVPLGIRTDVTGRFYVCARGLFIYTPAGKLEVELFKDEVVTNCAFGDADFETLYAATPKAVYKLRLNVKGAVQY